MSAMLSSTLETETPTLTAMVIVSDDSHLTTPDLQLLTVLVMVMDLLKLTVKSLKIKII